MGQVRGDFVAQEKQRKGQQVGHGVGVERRGEGLFAQLFAFFVYYNRDVAVGWRRVAQELLQMHLAWRGIEQIGSAHHVGDALEGIINDDGQLVGEDAIGSQNGEVIRRKADSPTRAAGASTACGGGSRAGAGKDVAMAPELVDGIPVGIETPGTIRGVSRSSMRTSHLPPLERASR